MDERRDDQRQAGSSRRPVGARARHEFTGEYLVICPRCMSRARVRGPVKIRSTEPAQFSCAHCGMRGTKARNAESAARGPVTGGPHDGYFILPLWLQVDCGGEILYANNAAHLDFLERAIAAEQDCDPRWESAVHAGGLEPWMKRPENRERVMRGIRELKARLMYPF